MMKYFITLVFTLVTINANAAILVFSPNGSYTTKTTLYQAATAADAAGKTIVVTSALSAVQSNISSATIHSWPTDRTLRVEKGGSINPTTAFTGLPYAEPEWFGANTTPGTTDMSAAINKALAAAPVVDCKGILSKIDTSITVPAGKQLKNVNFVAGTAGMDMVLVNSGSKVNGVLTGTGATSTIERGIYPAADGIVDVYLDVEVSNLTVGVHAQYLTTYSEANAPKRWNGRVYAHEIVGTAGASEGYGLILSPAENCNFDVKAKDISRHAVYLSAGSKHNKINVDVDGCDNYAVQLYSTDAQEETTMNTVVVNARNLGENVSGQSGAVAIIRKSNRNTAIVNHEGNNATAVSVLVEGSSGGPYPTANKIIDGSITGQFTGTSVIKMLNADSTVVSRNSLHAYGTNRVISMERTGTNGSTHGGFIYDNDIDAQAQSIRGIYNEINAQPSFIGLNNIRNNGTGLRVDDQTGGKRQGFSRKLYVTGTTASINAGETGDVTVPLPDDLQTTRHSSVSLTGASVQYFNKILAYIGTLSTLVADEHGLRFYNGHSAAQTIDFEAVIEGD